jgi:hypothetical protein
MSSLKKSVQLFKTLTPAKVMRSRLHKRVFMQFAEKIGLVYFGYVDQQNDEHRLVRGLTVSARHRDNHYCIGTFDNYDITLVERSDTIRFPGKSPRAHNWIIMTFDLHTSKDVPHIFLGLHNHDAIFYAQLFTKFSQLTEVPLGRFGSHNKQFTDKYALYAEPAHMIFAEQLFHPEITNAIVESFNGFTVEIADESVYLYAEHAHPSVHLLERMLKNGLWLAKTIDLAMAHQDIHT